MQEDSRIRLYFVFVLTGINIFFAGMFIYSDWGKELVKIISGFPFYLKGLFSLISTIIVWSAGKYTLKQKVTTLFKISFLFTFIGDIGFIIPPLTTYNPQWLFVVAMSCYIIFHILSIFRYTNGIKETRDGINPVPFRIITAVVLICAIFALLFALSGKLIEQKLFIPVSIYGLVLVTDVFFGINTLTLKAFPLINARLITAGIIFFSFCDMGEALKLATMNTPVYDIAVRMTWLFYGPALILLGLSGYQWADKDQATNK